MVHSIVILGNNTCAWLAANFLALRRGPGSRTSITVMTGGNRAPEGASFGYAGFRELIDTIGLSESELLSSTDANVCLANRYVDWAGDGHEFFHAPAEYGVQHIADFHHLAIRLREMNRLRRFDDYSLGAFAAKLGRFAKPGFIAEPVARTYSFGYQFRTDLLADLLRQRFSQYTDVQVSDVPFQTVSGSKGIEAIKTTDGNSVTATLYIDTRDSTADEIWMVQTARLSRSFLCAQVDFRAAEHAFKRIIHCRTSTWADTFALAAGARPYSVSDWTPWENNTIRLNPQQAIAPCLTMSGEDWLSQCLLFLDRLYPADLGDPLVKEEFNRLVRELSQQWIDLQTAAMTLAQGDSEFYQALANSPRSDALQWKLRVFRATGRVAQFERESVSAEDWTHLLLGLEFWPLRSDVLISTLEPQELERVAEKVVQTVQAAALRMPPLPSWLNRTLAEHDGDQQRPLSANSEKTIDR